MFAVALGMLIACGEKDPATESDTDTDADADTDSDTDTDTDSDTDADTDSDTDADTDTDPVDPCVHDPSTTSVAHTDLGAVETGCFDPSTTFPAVFDTEAELAAVRVCDDLWPTNIDWDTERLVMGASSDCGTVLEDFAELADGTWEALVFGLGCGAPMQHVHAIIVPDGPNDVTFTVCDQDTTPYP